MDAGDGRRAGRLHGLRARHLRRSQHQQRRTGAAPLRRAADRVLPHRLPRPLAVRLHQPLPLRRPVRHGGRGARPRAARGPLGPAAPAGRAHRRRGPVGDGAARLGRLLAARRVPRPAVARPGRQLDGRDVHAHQGRDLRRRGGLLAGGHGAPDARPARAAAFDRHRHRHRHRLRPGAAVRWSTARRIPRDLPCGRAAAGIATRGAAAPVAAAGGCLGADGLLLAVVGDRLGPLPDHRQIVLALRVRPAHAARRTLRPGRRGALHLPLLVPAALAAGAVPVGPGGGHRDVRRTTRAGAITGRAHGAARQGGSRPAAARALPPGALRVRAGDAARPVQRTAALHLPAAAAGRRGRDRPRPLVRGAARAALAARGARRPARGARDRCAGGAGAPAPVRLRGLQPLRRRTAGCLGQVGDGLLERGHARGRAAAARPRRPGARARAALAHRRLRRARPGPAPPRRPLRRHRELARGRLLPRLDVRALRPRARRRGGGRGAARGSGALAGQGPAPVAGGRSRRARGRHRLLSWRRRPATAMSVRAAAASARTRRAAARTARTAPAPAWRCRPRRSRAAARRRRRSPAG